MREERELQSQDFNSIWAWLKYADQNNQSKEKICEMKHKVAKAKKNFDKVAGFAFLMTMVSVFFDAWTCIPVSLISIYILCMKAPLNDKIKENILDAIETFILVCFMVFEIIKWRM